MSALDALKRAPKWTWYVVGGVGVGAVAIKFWQGRDADPSAATAADGTPIGDAYPGTAQPATTGSSPPGVIVPPIVMGSDGASAGELGAAFAGLVGGTITDLSDLAGRAIDAQGANNAQWIDAFGGANSQWVGAFGQSNSQWIDALAAAGSVPQPVAQNPTPVNIVVNNPAPPPVIAAPPTSSRAPDPCTGEFNLQEDDARSGHLGQCYKVGQTGHGRFHIYKSGAQWKVPGS